MYYKLVSDIDGLSIEWDTCYGRHWQSFNTQEELSAALKENEEYNSQPDVAAQIKADLEEGDRRMAQYDFNGAKDLIPMMKKSLLTLGLFLRHYSIVGGYYNEVHKDELSKLIKAHNKAILAPKIKLAELRSKGGASFKLGDVMKKAI